MDSGAGENRDGDAERDRGAGEGREEFGIWMRGSVWSGVERLHGIQNLNVVDGSL